MVPSSCLSHAQCALCPAGHNGRRFDGSKSQSLMSFYQTVSCSFLFNPGIASRQCGRSHPYKANHHQVSEPGNDSHQEQEQLLFLSV